MTTGNPIQRWNLSDLGQAARNSTDCYLEFCANDGASGGVYVVPKGSVDKQLPHDQDEYYYVVSGAGRFRIENGLAEVSAGTCLYVPAHASHQFVEVTEDLVLFVVFCGKKFSKKSSNSDALVEQSATHRVRSATAADMDPWLDMRRQLWPSTSREDHLEEMRDSLENAATANFVAENLADSSLDGFLELSLRPFVNGCDTKSVSFVEGVWVEERVRRQGVGKLLIGVAQRWGLEQGSKELGSDTDLANETARQAHVAWGFEETERVAYFRKKLL